MSMPKARSDVPGRSRPRERKRQIEAAAALAFAERGYHQVTMQDVATAVGISAPALYRHFPNKYALFLQTVSAMAGRLLEATAEAARLPIADAPSARHALDMQLDALISTTIELRVTAGVYRWEGRYLEKPDRDRLTADFRTLRGRMTPALRVCRPELGDEDAALLVMAAVAAVASITSHRTVVGSRALRTLLSETAWRLLEADIPSDDGEERRLVTPPPGISRRERLIVEAISQFYARGYHDVTIEDIAHAVDLTASGVYRHFDSKSAMLMDACLRASAELESARVRAQEVAASPREVLEALCDDYVRHSFENYQLVGVWVAEVPALDLADARRMRSLQRAYAGEWADVLVQARTELSRRDAVVLVYAAFTVVADVAQLLHHRTNPGTSRRVAALMLAALGLS